MATDATIYTGVTQRRWERYPFEAQVRVTIDKPRRTVLVNTRAYQVNDGGIAIQTSAKLQIGTQAKIEFAPPSFDFPLSLRGVVCNRAGGQYGLEFVVTSLAEKEHLILFQEILHAKMESPDA